MTGQPVEGAHGAYRLRSGADPELLIAGDELVAIGWDDEGDLVWAGSLTPRSDPESEFEWILRSTPKALIEAFGSSCQGVTVRGLNEIAREAFEATGFDITSTGDTHDWSKLGTALQKANAITIKRLGMPLPTTASAIDSLTNSIARTEDPTDHGMWLLTAMVSRCLMDEGAEWVASNGNPLSVASIGSSGNANDFGVTANPLRLVVETGMPDSETYSPIQSTLETSLGRRILLGLDETALAAKLKELDRPGWAANLATQSVESIQLMLAANRANQRLRAKAYDALARSERFEDALQLAANWGGREDSSVRDDLAWLGSRASLHVFRDTPKLIEDAFAAITRHPHEAQLYVILGVAYEATSDEDDELRARACYAKAMDLSWGDVRDLAQTALDRLDEE